MRRARDGLRGLLAGLLVAAGVGVAAPAAAQDAAPELPRAGMEFGLGEGLVRAGVAGIYFESPLGESLSLQARVSAWSHEIPGTDCTLILPSPCEGDAVAAMGGMSLRTPEVARVRATGEALVGASRFSGITQGDGTMRGRRVNAAVGAGAGAVLRLAAPWSLRIGGRVMRPLDQTTYPSTGSSKKLSFWAATIAAEVDIRW